MTPQCLHIDQIRDVTPAAAGCVDCLRIGDGLAAPARLHELRICGLRSSTHPIVQSYEPGEDWYWCYGDEVGFLLEGTASLSYA